MINTNRHPISYRFEVIADYCSNFGHFAFEPPPTPRWFSGNVHCLFVLTELFRKLLRLRRYERILIGKLQNGVSERDWSISAKFLRSTGHPPRTIFARIDRPVNALQLYRRKYAHKETL